MGVKCFLVTDSGRSRLSLRRYVSGDNNCPKGGYHNASGPIIAVINMGTNSFHMIVCQALPDREHFDVESTSGEHG